MGTVAGDDGAGDTGKNNNGGVEMREYRWNKYKNVKLFTHHYGYEKPVTIHKWSWSVDFGRWSALVTFQDGWHGWSYPKTF